jgi:hypothetical protein
MALGTLPVLGWLWLVTPLAAMPATLAFGGFLVAEYRRARLASRVDHLGLGAGGALIAGADGGPWKRSVRAPVVLPGCVFGRLADGGAVAVTPGSAGAEGFRRLVVALRESARRGAAPAGFVSQAR